MSDWQPIETAPMDATPVLLWQNGRRITGRWMPRFYGEVLRWDMGNWQSSDGFDLFYQPPTHWMPLPEPPSEQAAEPSPQSAPE